MADTRDVLVEGILAHAEALDLESLAQFHCQYQHHEDPAAQVACEGPTLARTRDLLRDLPALLPGVTARALLGEFAEDDAPGATRFGGLPDLPTDMDWPDSGVFTVADALAQHAPNQTTDLDAGRAVPMTFVAQIDLAALPAGEQPLPDTGRLLVFMDFAVWFRASHAAGFRVIWDQTPRAALARRPAPDVLPALEALAAQEFAQAMVAYGLDGADTPFNAGFVAPARALTFRWQWMPLWNATVEFAQSPLGQRIARGDVADIYAEVQYTFEDSLSSPAAHQLLGTPNPQQDDPRFDAILAEDLGTDLWGVTEIERLVEESGLDQATWDAAQRARAAEFQLLLQLDVAEFLGANAEGTYYFLIRKADLAARAFDRVRVVYQQT